MMIIVPMRLLIVSPFTIQEYRPGNFNCLSMCCMFFVQCRCNLLYILKHNVCFRIFQIKFDQSSKSTTFYVRSALADRRPAVACWSNCNSGSRLRAPQRVSLVVSPSTNPGLQGIRHLVHIRTICSNFSV